MNDKQKEKKEHLKHLFLSIFIQDIKGAQPDQVNHAVYSEYITNEKLLQK